MPFTLLPYVGNEPQHARFDESLIALAAQQGPSASIWEAEQGLVVPRTYRRYADFEQACEQLEQAGWPVTVRQSGGGIVPQGRSEERRVGKEGVSTCRSRWSAEH